MQTSESESIVNDIFCNPDLKYTCRLTSKFNLFNILHVRSTLPFSARYQDLKEYKARNGDCNVPMRKDDPKLGEWVGQQRRAYRLKMDGKQSAMTDERMEKLNNIGFTWRLRKRKTHPECEDEGGNEADAMAHAGDDVGRSEEETATAVVEQVAKHLAACSANAEDDAQPHVEV